MCESTTLMTTLLSFLVVINGFFIIICTLSDLMAHSQLCCSVNLCRKCFCNFNRKWDLSARMKDFHMQILVAQIYYCFICNTNNNNKYNLFVTHFIFTQNPKVPKFVFLMLLYIALYSRSDEYCVAAYMTCQIYLRISQRKPIGRTCMCLSCTFLMVCQKVHGDHSGSHCSTIPDMLLCPCMPLTLELHMWTEIDGWP